MHNQNTVSQCLARLRDVGANVPPGLSAQDIDGFVFRTGLTVPQDLRDWLMITNGPNVGRAGIYGIRPARDYLDIESKMKLSSEWDELGGIPVAGDGCGSYYIICTRHKFGGGTPVVFCDHSEGYAPTYLVGSDFAHFIEFMLREELGERWWPFDRNRFVQEDPGILSFHSIRLPWECD